MSAMIFLRARSVNRLNLLYKRPLTSAIPQSIPLCTIIGLNHLINRRSGLTLLPFYTQTDGMGQEREKQIKEWHSVEQKIRVGKYNINYLRVGNGPHHLLCFPGTFGTIRTDFTSQVEGFDRNKFTLVVWDPPGQGKSRPPEKIFDFDFFIRDADYAYEFMKALKIDAYSVLGWSAGGTVAMMHAAKYSDIVRKLIVWGCGSFISPIDFESIKKLKNLNNWSKSYANPLIDTYRKENLSQLMSKWTDLMSEIFNTRAGNLCVEMLPNIKCPTYILHCENDPASDINHVSHLLENITGSRYHIYPDGKHNIHIKNAEDFNKRVQEFLLE